MSLNLDYYYGAEAEQYSFYRVPKTLLTDPRFKGVSIEAKVLYGLLLDRMSLSVRNGWMDKDRCVYIYFTQEDAMNLMSCGKDKATRLFRELDQGGIGLIERKKQGQGRPARIYVKNFTPPSESGQALEGSPPQPVPPASPQTAAFPQSRPLDSTAVKTADFARSAPSGMSGQDSGFCAPNKTERNQTDLNQPDSFIPPPSPWRTSSPAGTHRPVRMDEMDGYRERIRENIGYDLLCRERPYDVEEIDGYVELMAETCASRRGYIRVNGEEMPAELVRERLLKLDGEHIRYVMDSLRQNTAQVVNIRAYTLAALYNAPTTISQYYTAQVSHDMARGFRGRVAAP
ncbi:MAG: replication initiator protein A [Oscillospiraceae bacterium]|nr:replication initiator protein A [Oscillospiraceae bacterium]